MRHNRCVCRRRRILVAAGSDPKPGWDGPGPAFHFKVVAPENRTDGRYGWSGQAPALVGATQTQWDPPPLRPRRSRCATARNSRAWKGRSRASTRCHQYHLRRHLRPSFPRVLRCRQRDAVAASSSDGRWR